MNSWTVARWSAHGTAAERHFKLKWFHKTIRTQESIPQSVYWQCILHAYHHPNHQWPLFLDGTYLLRLETPNLRRHCSTCCFPDVLSIYNIWQNSVNLLCLQISWRWALLSKGLQDMFSGWLVTSWYSHSSNDRNLHMPWRPQDEIVLVQSKISRIKKELLFCKESHLPGGSVFNQNFPQCHKFNPRASHNACLDCLKCRKHQRLSTMKS